MSDYTVLVLGAGASLSYGLPLGTQLIEKICAILPSKRNAMLSQTTEKLKTALEGDSKFINSCKSFPDSDTIKIMAEFRNRLKHSAPKSIDDFLSKDYGDANDAFRLIGKLAIAFSIASTESREEQNQIEKNSQADHWYKYLWQHCINNNCRSYADIKEKKLRIISFNYDRSLEYFLGKKLSATYFSPPGTLFAEDQVGKWSKPGFEAIQNDFLIEHPYGTLGKLTDIEYDGGQTSLQIHGMTMASNIQVIGEERSKSDDSFKVAKEWLQQAKKVVFLGFSYDDTNMERLGLSSGLPRRIQTNQSINSRQVFPLTYGLLRAERVALTRKYFSDFDFEVDRPSNDYSPISEAHETMQITQYLRSYGGLTGL